MKENKKPKLPNGWRWAKLGGKTGVAKIVNGATPSTDEPKYWNGDILWATPADVGNLQSIYIEDTERKITKAGLDSCSTKLLPVGTVLLTSRAPVGNLVITRKPICTNQGFKSFVPENGIDSLYLYFAIRKIIPDILKDVHLNTFGEITKEQIQDFEILLPPTHGDQIRIATQLELKMADVEKMCQAALRRKEAISAMQGAILREVFPWEEGDELPAGWAWDRLREVCFINPSRSKGFSREPNAPTTFVPMEAIDDLTGKITRRITRPYSEIAEGYTYFEEGDVLFAKITPCMENGRSAIAENLLDGVGFGSTEFHVLRARNNLTKEWVYHFIRTKEFRRRAEKKFNGSAGQQRVPTDFIKNSFIPFPTNSDEQIHITSELQHKLAEIVKISQHADRELEAIEALPGAILREVFNFGPKLGDDDGDKEQVQQRK